MNDYDKRLKKARKNFKKKVLDRQVFQDFPHVRDIIGNYGEPVQKVRPVGRIFGLWLTEEYDDHPVEAWVIADWDTWRRDLIPCEVTRNKRTGSLIYRSAVRTLTVRTIPTGYMYDGVGLLLFVEGIGFIQNAWEQGAPHIDDFHFDQSIKGDYCFNCDVFTKEQYVPLEDVTLTPADIGT